MPGKPLQSPLFVSCFLIALLLLNRQSNLSQTFIHSLIDTFAGGRSGIKVSLFLLFALLLCSLAFVPRVYFRRMRIGNRWLIGILAFAYNILLLYLYFQKLGFKISDFVITFNAGEISSTMLAHNHLMKGFNGQLLHLFGAAIQENMDTGWAFAGLLPSPLYWFGGLLVLASLITLVVKYMELYDQQKKWHGLFIVTYAVISFSLLKNMLDGGPFNRETPIAFVALLFLIWPVGQSEYGKNLSWQRYIPAVVYTSVMVLLRFAGKLNIGDAANTIYLMATFTVITMTMLYWLSIKTVTRVGVLLAILAGTMLYDPLANAANTYLNSQLSIPQDGAFVGLYSSPQNPVGWKKVEDINSLGIYSVVPKNPITIEGLKKENKLLSNLGPITIPKLNCIPNSPAKKIQFELATLTPLGEDTKTYQFGNLNDIHQSSMHNGLHRYLATAVLKPCAPRVLNIIQELIEARGPQTFFIVNIKESDELF